MSQLQMPMNMTGRMTKMKTNKIIFIYQNLHDIISFIKLHKIKHGPFNKARHYIKPMGHMCEIYDIDHLALLNLGHGDSFVIVKSNERVVSYPGQHKAIVIGGE